MGKLTCSKRKLVTLCCEFGYAPHKPIYTKAYRDRTWWLEWQEGEVAYKASFSTCAGHAMLGIEEWWYDANGDIQSKWTAYDITTDQLNCLGLIEKEGEL